MAMSLTFSDQPVTIPEPATIALSAAGVAALALFRRYRKA